MQSLKLLSSYFQHAQNKDKDKNILTSHNSKPRKRVAKVSLVSSSGLSPVRKSIEIQEKDASASNNNFLHSASTNVVLATAALLA